MSRARTRRLRRIPPGVRAPRVMTQTSTLSRPTPSVTTPQEHPAPAPVAGAPETLIEARNVSVFYGPVEAIKRVSLTMPRNRVVAMIGPSGCGKSTFLRSINRLNDLIPGCRVTGQLTIGGHDIYAPG